jgi:hypothetical protein
MAQPTLMMLVAAVAVVDLTIQKPLRSWPKLLNAIMKLKKK